MIKVVSLAFLGCLMSNLCHAHTINYKLYQPTYDSVWLEFIVQGFKHILPLGLDHILFIACVFFLNNSLKTILQQATFFTLAHSITLTLAANGYLVVPSLVVEPVIALSIAVLAFENIFSRKVYSYRLVLIFIFGLIHGMGFASALSELQLPSNEFAKALLSFNIGVELGQITVIGVLFFLINLWLKNKIWYRSRILVPANIGIGFMAIYWTISRIV
jgi:HupE / UreJ protein